MRLISMCVAVCVMSTTAFGERAWMHVPSRQVSWHRPASCTVGGVAYAPPTSEMLQQAGYLEVEWDDTYAELRYRVIEWDPPSVRAFTAAEKLERELSDAAATESDYASRVAEIAQTAGLYRLILRKHFGMGAETNRAITVDAGVAYFTQKQLAGTLTTQDLADAVLLDRLVRELREWTGTGEAWSIPWELLP